MLFVPSMEELLTASRAARSELGAVGQCFEGRAVSIEGQVVSVVDVQRSIEAVATIARKLKHRPVRDGTDPRRQVRRDIARAVARDGRGHNPTTGDRHSAGSDVRS